MKILALIGLYSIKIANELKMILYVIDIYWIITDNFVRYGRFKNFEKRQIRGGVIK